VKANNQQRPNGIFYGWVIVAVMWLVNFSTMATGQLHLVLVADPGPESNGGRDHRDRNQAGASGQNGDFSGQIHALIHSPRAIQ
jgi:hypothetical protein